MRDTNQTLRIVLGATLILAPVLLNEAHTADPRATPAATATVNVTSEPAEPELFDPTGHTLAITALAFSPDGKQILTGGTDGLTIVWDVAKAEAAHVFQTPSVDSHDPNSPLRAVRSVAFSGDGQAVLVGDAIDSAQLLDLPTGKVLQTFKHGDFVESAAFSPDGKQILTGGGIAARLWDTVTGRLLQTVADSKEDEGLRRLVYQAIFSPDGKHILMGSGNTVRLWDAATGKTIRTFVGHTGIIRDVVFAAGGQQILTTSEDDTTRIWDVKTGQILRTLQHPALAFSPDGTEFLVDAGKEGVEVWSVATGDSRRIPTQNKYETLARAAFSPDGKHILTGGQYGTVRLFDAQTGQQLHVFFNHRHAVYSATFSPDGKQIYTTDWTVRVWDAATGQLKQSFDQLNGRDEVVISPDGKQILTDVGYWDAQTGQSLHTFGANGDLASVAFSRDGKQIVTGDDLDGAVRMWDAASGSLLRSFFGHHGTVSSVAFSPDGKQVLSGGLDQTVRLWDSRTGRLLRTFDGANHAVFSPDGTKILVENCCIAHTLVPPQGSGTFYTMSPTARLIDVATGNTLMTFRGHKDSVGRVAYSPDGKQVLTASWDSTARLWDAATGQLLTTFSHHFPVISVAFSPDGQEVLTGSADCSAALWDAKTGKLLHVMVMPEEPQD